MKRNLFSTLVLSLLLSISVLSVGHAQTNVIRNGSFDSGLTDWVLNPKLSTTDTWPLQNGKVNLNPAVSIFKGTIIYQNLNVTNIDGKTFNVSMKLTTSSGMMGNSIAVYLSFVDIGNNIQRVKVLNPDNTTITTDTAVSGSYPLQHARKLVKIEIAKEDYGDFFIDDITLSSDGITVGPTPAITSVTPSSGQYNSPITIAGSNFGPTQGSVLIGDSSAGVVITNWSDTSITATIQDPAGSGRVCVVSDYVESNIDKAFDVTSPNFSTGLMENYQTVVKGQTAEYVIKVDFNNGFTTTAGINFSVDNSTINSVSTFTPTPIKNSGGALMKINTAALNPGSYEGKILSALSGSATRSTPFTLNVIAVDNIRFYEYDASYNKVTIQQKNITKQGEINGINFEPLDSNGKIISMVPFTVTSGNPSILGVYSPYAWGYAYYANDNGSTTLNVATPDEKTGQLPINIAIPQGTSVITSLSLSPNPISNKSTDPVSVLAHAAGTAGSYGWGITGFISGDNTLQWSSDYTQLSGTFKIDMNSMRLDSSYVFSATIGSSTRATGFSVYNDPTYSAIKGDAKSIDPDLPFYATESFILEFYQGANKVFSRDVFTMQGTGGLYLGAITPGVYTIRITPPQTGGGSFKPQWYPNADDAAAAQAVTFTAGQAVENIYFFLKSQPQTTTYTISGTVSKSTGQTSAPLSGVTVSLSGASSGNATTDSSGNYSFSGLADGSYTVTPTLQDYTFIPSKRDVTINGSNAGDRNFAGSNYAISGQVKDLATTEPIQGASVTVKDAASGSAVTTVTTDASGSFVAAIPTAGDYVLSATKTGYDIYYQIDPPYTLTDTSPRVASILLYMEPSGTASEEIISLSAGWNFISIPVQPASTAIEDVLKDISHNIRVVWGYDNQNKQWLKYLPSRTSNELSAIEPGKGYWIYINSPADLYMTGSDASKTIQLSSGWNLVGYNGSGITDVRAMLNSVSASIIWTWENGQWSAKHAALDILTVQPLSQVSPKKAYWIKANAATGWQQ